MTSIADLYQTLHSKSIQRFFSVLSKVLFQKKIFIYTDKEPCKSGYANRFV